MNEKIEKLMDTPIWQMTGKEFLALNAYAGNSNNPEERTPHYIYGIQALSKLIGCCPSTIYGLKKEGVLDEAIVSNVGKKIVFDGDKARLLASQYMASIRKEKKTYIPSEV